MFFLVFTSPLFISVTNIGIFSIWGKKNGPWVQALHCLFVVGMLLAPVISRPFLSNTDKNTSELTDNQNSTVLGEQLNKTAAQNESQVLPMDEVDLTYPYFDSRDSNIHIRCYLCCVNVYHKKVWYQRNDAYWKNQKLSKITGTLVQMNPTRTHY